MCSGSSTACADGSTIYSAAVPCGRRHCPFQIQTRSPTRLATSGPTDDPEAIYDPEIWDTSGFALVLSWLAQKWNQRCRKLGPLGKEQQKACLESAAAELIREITQGRTLN